MLGAAPRFLRVTPTLLPSAARSYPKELMKFFLSQMETSKESTRVGTLTLIRAVVSADGEYRAALHGHFLSEGSRGLEHCLSAPVSPGFQLPTLALTRILLLSPEAKPMA